jgi:hypothetical protein
MSATKNFIDFIKDACEDSPRRQEFANEVDKKDATKEAILKLLHSWGYNGVSLEDCDVVLRLTRAQGVSAQTLHPLY